MWVQGKVAESLKEKPDHSPKKDYKQNEQMEVGVLIFFVETRCHVRQAGLESDRCREDDLSTREAEAGRSVVPGQVHLNDCRPQETSVSKPNTPN